MTEAGETGRDNPSVSHSADSSLCTRELWVGALPRQPLCTGELWVGALPRQASLRKGAMVWGAAPPASLHRGAMVWGAAPPASLHKGAKYRSSPYRERREALPHASPYGKGVSPHHHASPYGKGRCHGVTEGIRVNLQKVHRGSRENRRQYHKNPVHIKKRRRPW